ncbi:hypothetical protein D0T25_03680 [Duganella sp. BJB488]|uniref:hypothetical protein n=1 Tax=unclassified Duganella TaxID=2636909 RepID=UPI000E3499F5|nr:MULTISPECIES: hypothetical protein [unclassified Duganella]NVD72152.1 hypothetical protein [Duganella sp. BJB1802]RFP24143.1 hypothetical protein D0T26_03725 [Duganella sp. BJB489]RFP26504.1 hypothetical protein D0T25_03680 [Duganella sp. BJB488]RFP34764.1 hypothetical protein D0T24_14345 [Duganella sp. BJB480]
MTIDPRDAIWNEAQDLLYRASYAGELKTALLARWVWLDSATKIAVAISSGGAALAGLVFWKNSDYTFLWPMFTSASALLAIVSRQLSVAEKVQAHATSAVSLSLLVIEIGSLIVRMKVNPSFSIAEFEKKLLAFRTRYGTEVSKFPYDLLLTQKLRVTTQAAVNQALGRQPKEGI